MRNILEKVRKRDYGAVQAGAPAIYRVWQGGHAQRAFQRFAARWRGSDPAMVLRLERDLPELLRFFQFPRHLWKKLRTTNGIERCFDEILRRTRPMVCSVNRHNVDRIIDAILNHCDPHWKNRTLQLFTQIDITAWEKLLDIFGLTAYKLHL